MATFSYIFNEDIFTTHDVRGLLNIEIKEDDAFYLGISFGYFLNQKRTIVKKLFGFLIGEKPKVAFGRDVRNKITNFEEAFIKGLVTAGINVVDTGELPIPTVGYCVSHFDCEAGVAVGGSSVGEEIIKFQFFLNNQKLTGEDIKLFAEKLQKGISIPSNSKGVINEIEILETYVSEILSTLNFNKENQIKVGIDCLHGTAGNVLRQIFKRVPLNMVIKNDTCTGDEEKCEGLSIEQHIYSLENFIEKEGVDIAFAVDGDGKQILGLTKNNQILRGDEIFFIILKNYFSQTKVKEKNIVIDLASSIEIEKKIKEFGGIPIVASTGQSSIREKMMISKAKIGMEAKGHIYIKDTFYGYDDGIFAILKILSILSYENRSIEDILNEIPFTFETQEIRIKTMYEDEKFAEIKEMLLKKLKPERIIEAGGIKLVFANNTASFMIRVCNTEDAISFKCEARNIEDFIMMENLLEEIKENFFN